MAETQQKPARPRVREQLELEVESLAYGGRGVARRNGYVVFVAGALPGDTRPRPGHQEQAPLRRGAHGRAAARPAPTASPTAATTAASPAPAPPGRDSPTSSSCATSRSRSTTRCGASAGWRASSWRRSSRRWSSGATATSSSTRSASATASWCSASTPAAAGTRSSTRRTACWPPRRNNARRNEIRAWAQASGVPAFDRRAGDGVLRNLVVREGRRTGPAADPPGHLRGRDPAPPGGPAHDRRGRGGRHRRPHRRARRRVPGGGAVRPALPHLAPRLLPDQHRDGRAPLRRSPPRWPASSGSERVFDLFCGIGTLSLVMARERRRGLGRRDRARGDRRRRARTPS